MMKHFFFFIVFSVLLLAGKITPASERPALYLPMLEGKDVALVVNHTSLVGKQHLLDYLLKQDVHIRKIFAPEHGFRGDADAGAHIGDSRDRKTGVPIISLYGKHRKPTPDDLKDIENIPLSSPFGFQLPARAVGKFRSGLTPVFIERENSKRMITVEASKTERPLSEIIKDVNQVLESYPFPEQYFYELGGDWKDKQEAFSDLGIMLIISLFLLLSGR